MTPTCYCRTFAIGFCADCGQPTCAEHSSTANGPRLCFTCMAARTPEGRQHRAKAEQRAIEGHEKRLERIASIEDPIERLLSAVRFVTRDLGGIHPADWVSTDSGESKHRDSAAARSRQARELERACPVECAGIGASAFEGRREWTGTWDSDEVGLWFAARRIGAGIEPHRSHRELERRRRILGSRLVEVARHDGWAIRSARGSELLIFTDGRVCSPPGGFPALFYEDGPPEARSLELGHLEAIAEMLKLPWGVAIADSYPV